MEEKIFHPVIGLEVHVELKTKSKMFCRCSADYFGKTPNTHTCPVCLGLPGALPVPNKQAIEWCVLVGLALNCEIPIFSKFDRKNYFYPDLPKGYQISQYDQPFARNGLLKLKIKSEKLKNDYEKIIRIRRVHMEEDTGKLLHATLNGKEISLIDFNRSGVPLVEIVTEPDFENAFEVNQYLQKLQQLVRYLGVSNADMEKGDMRFEPNISLREIVSSRRSETTERTHRDFSSPEATRNDKNLPSYKVEVKNINSFKFVEKAIEYEIHRQRELLKRGETPPQETRGWHERKQKTVSQRIKEEANDYRYFPDPDLPPIRFTGYRITELKQSMPELPSEKFARFQNDFGLSSYDAEILTREKETADYFEEAVDVSKKGEGERGKHTTPKVIANWIINKKVDIEQALPAQLVQTIIQSTQTDTIDEKELEAIVKRVLEEHPKAVTDYKKGKDSAIMFLIGQVTKTLQRKVDISLVRNTLIKYLK